MGASAPFQKGVEKMPIQTNDAGRKTIIFGTGDILIHRSRTDSIYDNGLSFKQHEPREIGERTEEYAGIPLEEHDPEVHIIFNELSSIDVMIEMLQEIKELMMRE